MGIAVGDYNRDGRLDFFVTTFSDDYKTLYRNDGDFNFADVTYPAGLGSPTIPFLGWAQASWISTTTASWIYSSPMATCIRRLTNEIGAPPGPSVHNYFEIWMHKVSRGAARNGERPGPRGTR